MSVASYLCTSAEAVTLLGKRYGKARFMMHVGGDMPIVDEQGKATDRVFRAGLRGGVNVTRAEAIKFARDLSTVLQVKGGRLPISVHKYDNYTAIWIG